MKLSDVSIDRPVFTTMCTIALMVMGGLAVDRLGVDLFPDVSFPVVAITTTYPGAGPAVGEVSTSPEAMPSTSASTSSLDNRDCF